MEKEIFSSAYIKMSFDKELKLLIAVYLPSTENMTDQEWKELMLEMNFHTQIHKPVFFVDDNRQRRYGYSPEMQAWTLDLFINTWNKIGLIKYAQVLPFEILGKLTTMQIEELAINSYPMNFNYKMFENYENAINWIKE